MSSLDFSRKATVDVDLRLGRVEYDIVRDMAEHHQLSLADAIAWCIFCQALYPTAKKYEPDKLEDLKRFLRARDRL